MKEWLSDCDGHKPCYRPVEEADKRQLPTRLLYVRDTTGPGSRVGLVKTAEQFPGATSGHVRYAALSHPWGDSIRHPPYSTLAKDEEGKPRGVERFLEEGVPYDDMPQTFRDAVDVTRRLNLDYIWIDSLCIVQGDDGDFAFESRRMQHVYSGAYVVLAATRATGQTDGFLGKRRDRSFVCFEEYPGPEGDGDRVDGEGAPRPFYVCEAIDDFNADVVDGPLSRRGWVLQERALARRTIYFAAAQTYFECGQGVRCATLGTMTK
jgi:hypothetical protein